MVVLAAAVMRQTAQFAAVGANVPQNESSKERKFLGTFVPGSESAELRIVRDSHGKPLMPTSCLLFLRYAMR